jgi:putative lipoprotein (rSAM/lipoprotein system)
MFNNSLIKLSKLSAISLATLGIASSCKKVIYQAMYGVPSAQYIIEGTTVSAKNNLPIAGLRVVSEYDTSFSDNEGIFKIQRSEIETNLAIPLKFDDTDGTSNGEYLSKDTTIQFKSSDFSGGDGSWDEGTAQKNVIVKIQPK